MRLATLVFAISISIPFGAAASVVTYMDTETLVRLSPVIVSGAVVSVTPVEEGTDARLFTDVTLAVSRVFRGPAGVGRLRLRLPGGRLGDRESRVYGTPEFRVGESVIVFAQPSKAGWLTITGLFQGKISIQTVNGVTFAVRSEGADAAQVRVLPRGTVEPERQPLESWLGRLLLLVNEVPSVFSWDYRQNAALGDLDSEADWIAPNFTLLALPFRRFEPDSGQPVAYRFNSLNAPSVPGGARSAFETALAEWNAVSGKSLVALDGGDTSAQCFLTFDGVSGVSHGDPCDEMAPFDSSSCSGVLAIGGMSEINPFSTKTVNGQTFLQGLQGDVVLNSGADCFWAEAGNYEEVVAHELGHTFGLGHSCGDSRSPSCAGNPVLDEAQMRAFAHGDGRGADPRRDDTNGVRFLYPPKAFVELRANGSSFTAGQPISIRMDLNGTATADLWVVVVLPGGAVVGGLAAPSFQLGYAPDLPIASFAFSGAEPPGPYVFVAILAVPGSSPAVASNILSYGVAAFSFSP